MKILETEESPRCHVRTGEVSGRPQGRRTSSEVRARRMSRPDGGAGCTGTGRVQQEDKSNISAEFGVTMMRFLALPPRRSAHSTDEEVGGRRAVPLHTLLKLRIINYWLVVVREHMATDGRVGTGRSTRGWAALLTACACCSTRAAIGDATGRLDPLILGGEEGQ